MANSNLYRINLQAKVDTKTIKAQLAQIEKSSTINVKVKSAGATATAKEMSHVNRATMSASAAFVDITKKVALFGAATSVISGFTAACGSAMQAVLDFDKSLTELKKVSSLSNDELDVYTQKLGELGGTVARTRSELTDMATEFVKSGFSEEDSAELARVASLYQNVADEELEAGEAANFIISQMKAFKLEAADAEHIVDAVNQVSNNTAVSSADLATNIGKASAAMAQGNNTYEQTLAMMTGITEITRNGAKSARGLISVQSRLNQITDEGSSTGKKLTAWYKEHNIAIYDQEGQLKNLYEIAGEVAKIWDNLSKNEQMYYLNTQAGANQTQNLSALISNYDQVLYAHEQAINSVNSAQNENNRFMESAGAKIQNFKAAFQELALNLINSDLVKNIIDLGTALLKFANTDLGQATIKIAAFSGAIKGLGLILTKGGLLESITKLGTALKGLFAVTTTTQNFSNIYGAFGTANQTASALYGTVTKTSLSMKGLVTNIKAAVAAMSGLAKAGLVVGGIFALIQVAEYISGANDRAIENTKQKMKELEQTLQETENEFNDLAQKQVDLKRNGQDLTDIEKARLGVLNAQTLELREQLKEQRKQLKEQTVKDYSFKPKNANITDVRTTGIEGVKEAIAALQAEERAYKNLEGAYNSARQAREGEAAITLEYVGFLQETVEGLDDVANQYLIAIESGDGLSETEQQLLQDIINQNIALEEAGGKSNILSNAYIYLANNQAAMIPYIKEATKGLEQEGGTYVYTSNAAKKAAQEVIKAEMEATRATVANISARISARMEEAQSMGEFVKKSGVDMSVGAAMAMEKGESPTEVGQEIYKYYELQKALNRVNATNVKGGDGGSLNYSPSGGGGTGGGSGSSAKKTQDESEKIKKILDKLDDKYLESYQRREIIASKYYSKIQKKAWAYYKSGKIDHDEYNEYVQQAAKNIFEEIDYRYENGIYSADTYYKKVTYFANKFYKKTGTNNKITYEEYREYIKKATKATIDAVEEQYDKGLISGQDYFNKVKKLAEDAKKKKILSTKEYKDYMEKAYEKLFDSIADQYERGKISAEKYYNTIKLKGKQAVKEGTMNVNDFADALKEAAEAMKDMAQTRLDAFEFFAEDKKTAIDKRIEKEQLRIDGLNEQLEAMRKQNDELDKQAERMELVNALAAAKKNKIRIFDEKLGWVWTENPTAVQEAQKALDDFDEEQRREKAEQAIEDEIANIEKVIKNYEKQKQAYDDLINEQTRALERWEIENKLGMSIEQAVLQGRLDNFENFKTNYINGINEMITALERLANVQQEAETPMTNLERTEIAVKDALSTGIDKITGIGNAVAKARESAEARDKWNASIDKKIAEKQAEGKTVYVTVDDDGKKHYSTVSKDKAKDLAGGASTVTTVKPTTKNKAAGSHSLPSTDLYHINELGDELLVPPTGNLAYLTKGTGVIPAHLTSNLMDLGQYNMAQWAKLIGSANSVGSVDSHNVIIQNMTVQSDNANDFVRQLQNLAILKK